MGREHRSFDQAYREFLPEEQRREVLKALREKLDPETTFGEIVDAAQTLGWEEALSEVLLSELADALLGNVSAGTVNPAREEGKHLSGRARQLEAAIVERLTNWSDEDELQAQAELTHEEEDWEDEPPAKPRRGRPRKAQASKKKSSKKRATKKKSSKKKSSKKKSSKKRATKKKSSKKRVAKKKSSKKRVAKKKGSSKKRASKKKSSKKRAAKKKSSKKRVSKKKSSKKRAAKKKSGRRR